MAESIIILNGRRSRPRLVRQAAAALANRDILAEKGGFLLKATLGGNETHLDIVPCIVNGVRSYHYDMELKLETDHTLVGAVDANGVFTVFFQPKQARLPENDKAELRLAYQRLARLLFSHGFPGPGELDLSTGKLLEEAGVFVPAPKTLAELAEK